MNLALQSRVSSSAFSKALEFKNEGPPPVWFMRQAGRYLPEYQALRKRHSIETLFATPDLITEVTLQPITRFGLDAAILFSDILTILHAMGFSVTFPKGPQVTGTLQPLDLTQIDYVYTAIKQLKRELTVPLIGFCGGPYTIASYLLDDVKKEMYSNPTAFHTLLQTITDALKLHLENQVQAGVDALQIFDSWAGTLPYDHFTTFSLPYLKQLIHPTCPTILFTRNSSVLTHELAALGPAALACDWLRPLASIRKTHPTLPLQGNLDPEILLSTNVKAHTQKLLTSMHGDRGFILNLGHGILPTTPISAVEELLDTLRSSC